MFPVSSFGTSYIFIREVEIKSSSFNAKDFNDWSKKTYYIWKKKDKDCNINNKYEVCQDGNKMK